MSNYGLQSGVICEEYVEIDYMGKNGTLIFTGADGVVDGGSNETERAYLKVEIYPNYKKASERAPLIFGECP